MFGYQYVISIPQALKRPTETHYRAETAGLVHLNDHGSSLLVSAYKKKLLPNMSQHPKATTQQQSAPPNQAPRHARVPTTQPKNSPPQPQSEPQPPLQTYAAHPCVTYAQASAAHLQPTPLPVSMQPALPPVHQLPTYSPLSLAPTEPNTLPSYSPLIVAPPEPNQTLKASTPGLPGSVDKRQMLSQLSALMQSLLATA